MRYGREYDMERVYDTTEKRCVCQKICAFSLSHSVQRVGWDARRGPSPILFGRGLPQIEK